MSPYLFWLALTLVLATQSQKLAGSSSLASRSPKVKG